MLQKWMILAIVPALMAGCGPQYAKKAPELVPEIESEEVVQVWDEYGIPELDSLLEQSMAQNLDLKSALARIDQAEARVNAQTSALLPFIGTRGEVTTRKGDAGGATFAPSGPGGTPSGNTDSDEWSTTYSLSGSAQYEVDLWGKAWANRKTAWYGWKASELDLVTFSMTLRANLARAWFDALAAQLKLEVLNEQENISGKFLELTRLRLGQGLATALDVSQQSQQLESIKGRIGLIKAQEKTALHRLAVLSGKAPWHGFAISASSFPSEGMFSIDALPADLLSRRPDVHSSWMRLKSADAQAAAAVRDFLPTLSLSASITTQATDIADLFQDYLRTLGAELSLPLFQGGRRFAERKRTYAAAEEAYWNYGQSVLTALRETQDAIVLLNSQKDFVSSLEKQLEDAQLVLELARERYSQGATTYFRVLTALQSLQELQINTIDAKRNLVEYHIQLHRALGGGWKHTEGTEVKAPPDLYQ